MILTEVMVIVNLRKGERFTLRKELNLNKIVVQFTWISDVDLDASAFLVGEEGCILDDADFVFYNSRHRCDPKTHEDVPYSFWKFGSRIKWQNVTIPYSSDGSVIGSAYYLSDYINTKYESGGGTLLVILDKVKSEIREINFCIAIYHGNEGRNSFSSVYEPAISICKEESGEELCSYQLKEMFTSETAVVVAKLVLTSNGEWEFEALGDGYKGGMQTLIDLYA